MNTDDLIAQMEQDELKDELEESTVCTPINYAKAKGISPQVVYYHIRVGHLKPERCACGRRVINIEEADKLFRKEKDSEVSDTDD